MINALSRKWKKSEHVKDNSRVTRLSQMPWSPVTCGSPRVNKCLRFC